MIYFLANVQQWKSTCFPWHQHFDHLFVHIYSFFPFSESPAKVTQTWAFNLLLYEDLGIERDGYSEMRWIQSPSWKASEKTDRGHEWRWSGEISQLPCYTSNLFFCPPKKWNNFMIIPFGKVVTARLSVWRCFFIHFIPFPSRQPYKIPAGKKNFVLGKKLPVSTCFNASSQKTTPFREERHSPKSCAATDCQSHKSAF